MRVGLTNSKRVGYFLYRDAARQGPAQRIFLRRRFIDGSDIARRLRQARDEAGINQPQAADAIGVHRTAITQMEAGNRAVSS
jgi:DNA-binding XRE family transcriptional regulator